MSDMPPDWAIKRANDMFREMDPRKDVNSYGHLAAWVQDTFARYIASKEEAPVDPLVLEAREICARQWDDMDGPIEKDVAADFRRGFHDDEGEVTRVVAGIRRGIEIGKAQA